MFVLIFRKYLYNEWYNWRNKQIYVFQLKAWYRYSLKEVIDTHETSNFFLWVQEQLFVLFEDIIVEKNWKFSQPHLSAVEIFFPAAVHNC